MKVKVYNTREWVETETEGKYTTFREHKHAVIVGTKGTILTCDEGVHNIIWNNEKEETIELEIVTPSKPGTFKIMPDKLIGFTIDEMIAECPVLEEQELGQFIRKFGSRLESNYNTLLKSIRQIGLDSNDFPREV